MPASSPVRVTAEPSGVTVAEQVRIADTHWTRLRGLLGTRDLRRGNGLWIRPCRQVHMFGMRYAIDIVFLDDAHRVVGAVSDLRPWRVSPLVKTASSVLELPAGTIAQVGIHEGQSLRFAAHSPSGD